MYRLILLATLTLAACVEGQKERAGLRDPARMIASAALFEPSRFAGTWYQVAAYGADAACGRLREEWQIGVGGRYQIAGTTCARGSLYSFATEGALTGPGRITRGEHGQPAELWVLWVDADYRIAAIGTPSGGFGRILSRDPVPRADLFTAAREVLDFNGYDTRRLISAP